MGLVSLKLLLLYVQEVSLATITFADRQAAKLFGTLAFSILPEWQSIRRSKQPPSI